MSSSPPLAGREAAKATPNASPKANLEAKEESKAKDSSEAEDGSRVAVKASEGLSPSKATPLLAVTTSQPLVSSRPKVRPVVQYEEERIVSGGRRPVKIWNASRTLRKALVVSTYEEFERKGREKLNLSAEEPLKVILESDGTQVDDGEYFQTLPENSVFIFLRSGENWHPTGSDSVKLAVMESIPSIITDTLYTLGLQSTGPSSWKIMDNNRRITVVLNYDYEAASSALLIPQPKLLSVRSISQRSGSSVSSTPCLSRDNSRGLEKMQRDVTVIDSNNLLGVMAGSSGPNSRTLSRQGSSMESGMVPIHTHGLECSRIHQPVTKQRGSPTECDFHCCALHPPTPTPKSAEVSSVPSTAANTSTTNSDGKRSLPKGAHVRFSHVEVDNGAAHDNSSGTANLPVTTANSQAMQASSAAVVSTAASIQCKAIVEAASMKEAMASEMISTNASSSSSIKATEAMNVDESSESETENNDEVERTEKFLLLVDQLSVEQPHFLSIKDIGIILDRLSSKIIDVSMLERSIESVDTHNWTIKAVIRGEVMRELGVIYNSNYYAISEHPRFMAADDKISNDLMPDDNDDLDDDDIMDDFEEVDHILAPNLGPSQ